jgi:hypothetical protein
MNWSRGLFRLWAFVTALWVIAVVIFSLNYFSSPFWANEDVRRGLMPGQVWAFIMLAVIPPAVLFVFGRACLWVARGFSRHQP